MKAAILTGFGGVEKFEIQNAPEPIAAEDEVVVEIYSASLNRRDFWIRQNKYPGIKLPGILGSDGSGVIVKAGSEKNKNLIGKEVIIYPGFNWGDNENFNRKDFSILGMPTSGTFAELVSVPVENIFDKPKNLTQNEAASLPIAGITAFRAIVNKTKPSKNENILITGIGGGVAMFALQFSLLFSKNIFVTSSSNKKIEKAVSVGAKGGINYNSKNWKEELLAVTGGSGIDIIIDGTGGDTLSQYCDVINPGGRIAIYGGTSLMPASFPARYLFWKQLLVMGTTSGSPKEFGEMLNFIETNNIHPVIDSVFSLEEIREANKKLEDNLQCGKIVIQIKAK